MPGDSEDGEPVPAFVVQVDDEQLAAEGIEAIAECADEDAPGTAFSGDYMVVAETDDLAAEFVADGRGGVPRRRRGLRPLDRRGRWRPGSSRPTSPQTRCSTSASRSRSCP